MAAESDKLVDEIVKLATRKTPAGKTQFDKARDKLDAAFLAIEKAGHGENEKNKLLDDIEKKLKGTGKGIAQILRGDVVNSHDLIYDAFGEAMEPTYYWILDFMREAMGYTVEKTSDFFAASEASGYFGEMGQRRTALETRVAGGGQAPGLFGTINMIIKSIINLLYDLKTFDLRLKHYDDIKIKDPSVKKSAVEALKGIWLNEVDKTKGNAAIDMLAAQLNFITLRDSFMIVPVQDWYVHDADSKKISEIKEKAVKYVEKMDLTDVVKRILAPRVKEFVDWVYLSEKELRMRRSVEKSYLKAQDSALKAYTKWARPYLIATQKLIPAEYTELLEEHKELGIGPEAIPTPFHAMWFYLELLGSKAADIELTRPGVGVYKKLSEELKDKKNQPLAILNIRFAFRGSPQTTRGARGEIITINTGRLFVRFSGYVMQKKHLDLLLKRQDAEVMKFIDVMTTETLEAMADDLKKYMEEEKPTEEKAKTAFELPLSAFIKPIFGSIGKFNKQAKEVFKKMPKLGLESGEAWKIARMKLIAIEKAKKDSYNIFEKYRKANKMITPP
jgi:transcription antitermination factor NusG